jgi:hypothetical protein
VNEITYLRMLFFRVFLVQNMKALWALNALGSEVEVLTYHLSNLIGLAFFAILLIVMEVLKSEIMVRLKNSIREAALV